MKPVMFIHYEVKAHERMTHAKDRVKVAIQKLRSRIASCRESKIVHPIHQRPIVVTELSRTFPFFTILLLRISARWTRRLCHRKAVCELLTMFRLPSFSASTVGSLGIWD